MAIEYQIDHERRLVMARGYGTITNEDVFGYQQEVWSRPEVTGYDELIDMGQVEHIVVPSAERVRELASLSASMDTPTVKTKFAIVAPEDIAFGLGRMYEAYRELNARSTKEVQVFRSKSEALAWLGIPDFS